MLTVRLISPERVLYEGEAEMVLARTIDGGDVAFLTGHTPFLGGLATHALRLLQADGERVQFAVHGGFVEVADDRVIILSDVAEVDTDVDLVRAEAAKARAEEILRDNPHDADAARALQRADVRIAVYRLRHGASA